MAPHAQTQAVETAPRTVEHFKARVQQLGAELDDFILERGQRATAPVRHAMEDARFELMHACRFLSRAEEHHYRRRPRRAPGGQRAKRKKRVH